MSDDNGDFPEDWEGDDYWDGEAITDAFAEDTELIEIINQIGAEFGITDFNDIVILVGSLENANVSELRAQRFSSPEEAAVFLYDIGVFAFSDIIDYGDGVYGVLIPTEYEKPAA